MEAAANTVTWISLDQRVDARAPDPALLRAFWLRQKEAVSDESGKK